MTQLTRQSLFSLEEYSDRRDAFRASVMEEKKQRSIYLDDHVQLLFESRNTVQYQIQEMLRIEKIFEAPGIEEELEAYNPLIPDGDNWKATMMIQYDDVSERRRKLAELIDIENQVWVKSGDSERVYALADEDLERADESKTSAVHFLRFQLPADLIANAKKGEPISMGITHPRYEVTVPAVNKTLSASLISDLA